MAVPCLKAKAFNLSWDLDTWVRADLQRQPFTAAGKTNVGVTSGKSTPCKRKISVIVKHFFLFF